MSNLSKTALLDFVVPLAKDVLPKLATKATSSVLDKFERISSSRDTSFTIQNALFGAMHFLISFHSLVIVINYVIEKNDEFIPEIYIGERYFEKV